MAKVVITIEDNDAEKTVDTRFDWKGWPSSEECEQGKLTNTQLYGTALLLLAKQDRLDEILKLEI